jgi:5''-3'' exonuclease (including N-terminal domain of PolI)
VNTVYLIDASIYIFRYYFALEDHWFAENDYPTAAVYGYTRWLMRFLSAQQPTRVGACFDESLDSSFRNEIYADYKSSRALPDDALAFQLLACKKMTELFGVASFASARYEADDLLATLAQKNRAAGRANCVLTRDKDLAQIILGARDQFWDYPDGEPMGSRELTKKMGVQPHQVADYLALIGDVSDDIPGVPGLGPKTAAALLQHFPNWESIKLGLPLVANLPIRGATGVAAKLQLYSAQIDMALQLTRVQNKIPLGRCDLRLRPANINEITRFAQYLGFGQGFIASLQPFERQT